MDKYGSVEEIEKNAIGADGYEYMFANTNNLIDEVLEERRMGNAPLSITREDKPEKRNRILPEDDDFSLDGLALSDKQIKSIKNLDMANQLTVIKALREQLFVMLKPHTALNILHTSLNDFGYPCKKLLTKQMIPMLNKIDLEGKSSEFKRVLKLNYEKYLRNSPDANKYKGWFLRIRRL